MHLGHFLPVPFEQKSSLGFFLRYLHDHQNPFATAGTKIPEKRMTDKLVGTVHAIYELIIPALITSGTNKIGLLNSKQPMIQIPNEMNRGPMYFASEPLYI